MFCSKCGQSIADGSKFCPYCGAAAKTAPTPPAAPAEPPRLCPFCFQEIHKDATRCPHCTSELPAVIEEKK